MSRDYKPARKKPAKKSSVGWAWLLTGLLIGLFVAGLVYLKENYSRLASPPARVAKAKEAPAKKAAPDLPPPPNYDFYTLLPEMEVVLPEQGNTPSHSQVRPVTTAGTYVLQAGAFRKYQDADRLKASLALVGVEAHIEKVSINNQDTWHRVRIGPYRDLQTLNRVRSQLKQHNINAILLQVNPDAG